MLGEHASDKHCDCQEAHATTPCFSALPTVQAAFGTNDLIKSESGPALYSNPIAKPALAASPTDRNMPCQRCRLVTYVLPYKVTWTAVALSTMERRGARTGAACLRQATRPCTAVRVFWHCIVTFIVPSRCEAAKGGSPAGQQRYNQA